jgi:hypothetical protein
MVLDLNKMSVNSKPGSHTQLTYKEDNYWIKETEIFLTKENYELDSNTIVFDVEEYQRLQSKVDWVPKLLEYKCIKNKHIWKYENIEGIIDRKKRDYYQNMRDFGKYFLGEFVPYMLNYKMKNDMYFFHIDPGVGNFNFTTNGFCVLEPNNWQWVTEDKFHRIVRYAIQKFVK